MSTLKSITESSLQHSVLKQRHRQVRDGHPASLTLRVHRALSWLNRAEQAEDVDGKFIFLWIAFNAAYAQELDDNDRTSDKATFKAFLQKLCDLDASKRIDDDPEFGYCIDCGEEIGFARLRAMPETVRCVDCAK